MQSRLGGFKQGDSKNGERDNFESVSVSETCFRTQKAAMYLKK